tara:strand:+ start:1307 stop:1519 length:213 start_codon:yes stop_codon:yes gene_type:complete
LRFKLRQYQKLTGESGPKLAERLSRISDKDIGEKTLWNWINNRYTFKVYVECDDKNLMKITGVYKEFRII